MSIFIANMAISYGLGRTPYPLLIHRLFVISMGRKGLLRRYSGLVISDVTVEIRNSMQTH